MHIAYAFNMYSDNRGTSQNTGTLKMAYKQVSISTENDAFAFSAWDRFRTGSFTICYNNKSFYLANNYLLFTGQANLQPIVIDTNYKSKYGYVNMSEAKFGNISNGLSKLTIGMSIPFFQNINGSIGLDDEHIRHFFQNKLIHDNILIHALNPSAKNPYIPMLTEDGKAFLESNKQHIKPKKWIVQLGINDMEVY
jgi:hypothetical protein